MPNRNIAILIRNILQAAARWRDYYGGSLDVQHHMNYKNVENCTHVDHSKRTFPLAAAIFLVLAYIVLLTTSQTIVAQSLDSYSYDMGSPSVVDYYIDPLQGSDSNDGLSAASPWQTVQHAWNQIPTSTTLSQGYRFNLMDGNYGSDELPNYWELKRGTAQYPIILRAASGQSAVKLTRDINMANVSYFYLIGVNITPAGGGDAFHCESCDHLLIRGCVLNGGSKTNGAHETLKVNQSQYVYVENNNIVYADDNNIDFVGVQYGHIIGNKVHEAADWCAYVKGGSAYIRVEANEFYNCGTGGFTAGQGSGFQFMTSPWLHYEAYDIKFINNLIYNTEGAAFGVNGGYNILLAHNTAYRVGTRSHLIEVVFGERTCDGETDGRANSTCASYQATGGWGPAAVRTSPEPIGNRNIYILNNIVYNPAGVSAETHFAIYGPRAPSGDVNLSSPQLADTNVVIDGNVIWNGNSSTALGVEDSSQGCQPSNASCNLTQLQSSNTINSYEPQLQSAESKDFRPQAGSSLLSARVATLATFPSGDRPTSPAVPEGVLANAFTRDFSGSDSGSSRIVGAFGSPDSSLSPAPVDGIEVPGGSTDGETPTISKFQVKLRRAGARVVVNVSARVVSESSIQSVVAEVNQGTKAIGTVTLTEKKTHQYAGKLSARISGRKKLTVILSATSDSGTSTKRSSARLP